MALIKVNAMFKMFPAKSTYKQKVKLRPIEHHYETEGEEPNVKYSCQICEQLAKKYNMIYPFLKPLISEEGQFNEFSFPKGTKRCPCCGVNIDWSYE